MESFRSLHVHSVHVHDRLVNHKSLNCPCDGLLILSCIQVQCTCIYIQCTCIYAQTGRVSCADVSVCVEGRSAGEGELCSGEGRPAGDPQVRLCEVSAITLLLKAHNALMCTHVYILAPFLLPPPPSSPLLPLLPPPPPSSSLLHAGIGMGRQETWVWSEM